MWNDIEMTTALCAAMLAYRRGDKAEAAKLIDQVVERVKFSYQPQDIAADLNALLVIQNTADCLRLGKRKVETVNVALSA